jgi:FemAB-related protein (PEP-CTERM system-associated)
LEILREGLGHIPYRLEVTQGDDLLGVLPLAFVRSRLFGKFLVSLPYLNYGGILTEDPKVGGLLVDGAIGLAEQLDVRYLELRHERTMAIEGLINRPGVKVHMRRDLPPSSDTLWQDLKSTVRNQIRKGRKGGFTIVWGGEERLSEFYEVFSHNMRDLGTPVYGRSLFRSVLRTFPERAEICVVRDGPRAVAAALILNGWGVTEVPSAGLLRSHRKSCANMLMYWSLLERAVELGQEVFDFGRSSPNSPTFQFKKQWGAHPHPAIWQYYLRRGQVGDMRPDNPRYSRAIGLWRRLPVPLTRWIGPSIVQGIP